MSRLYVAYGSNLNKEQMARRCPTAVVYGVGYLSNWEIIFRGRPESAVATIRRKKGSQVPVAIWNIEQEDEHSLDIYEGYPTLYRKQDVMVQLPEGKKKAMVYVMCSRPHGYPSQYYVDTIRQGYRDFGLDPNILDDALFRNKKER